MEKLQIFVTQTPNCDRMSEMVEAMCASRHLPKVNSVKTKRSIELQKTFVLFFENGILRSCLQTAY